MPSPPVICLAIHDDPFDLMRVAQAMTEGLTLITRDSRLSAYDVAVAEA
jgi:PIN domain nuclease of toxin-antitoxin system